MAGGNGGKKQEEKLGEIVLVVSEGKFRDGGGGRKKSGVRTAVAPAGPGYPKVASSPSGVSNSKPVCGLFHQGHGAASVLHDTYGHT